MTPLVQVCAMPACANNAYLECYVCGRLLCGTHTIRLAQWCQWHQDYCVECYEDLPAERKQVQEVEA